ncbi:MAG: LacI family transcriptional regulator, partial [Butyricicoccus sp.]|nr:LacI family transcriptional regulator [Butyricicoccus sp.]
MRHVTIKDIARIAGVSTSTVSRALSGSKELSEATRERIVKICNEQGYRVNALARSLIRSRTNVIGLIVPEVTNPFYAEISLGIETHARELGYNVMLCNSQQDTKTTEDLFGFLISHQVDGIILANSHSDAPRWLQQSVPRSTTLTPGQSRAPGPTRMPTAKRPTP